MATSARHSLRLYRRVHLDQSGSRIDITDSRHCSLPAVRRSFGAYLGISNSTDASVGVAPLRRYPDFGPRIHDLDGMAGWLRVDHSDTRWNQHAIQWHFASDAQPRGAPFGYIWRIAPRVLALVSWRERRVMNPALALAENGLNRGPAP